MKTKLEDDQREVLVEARAWIREGKWMQPDMKSGVVIEDMV